MPHILHDKKMAIFIPHMAYGLLFIALYAFMGLTTTSTSVEDKYIFDDVQQA